MLRIGNVVVGSKKGCSFYARAWPSAVGEKDSLVVMVVLADGWKGVEMRRIFQLVLRDGNRGGRSAGYGTDVFHKASAELRAIASFVGVVLLENMYACYEMLMMMLILFPVLEDEECSLTSRPYPCLGGDIWLLEVADDD